MPEEGEYRWSHLVSETAGGSGSPFLEVVGPPLGPSLPRCPGLGVTHASRQGVLIPEGDVIRGFLGPGVGRGLRTACASMSP